MSVSPPQRDVRYWAFISYSHADEAFAQWLHRAIETYRVPKSLVGQAHPSGEIPKRLAPVFRDRDDLASGPDLSAGVCAALASSRYLIVICSPRSAQSKYVNQEIRYFQSLGRARWVLPIILEGQPHGRDEDGENEPTCFPAALTGQVGSGGVSDERAEPIAADARDGKDGRANALLKVIAGLLGVGFDELRQRELQRQRARRRRMIAWCSLGVAAAALVYGVLCDADVNLPGSDVVRLQLDRRGWTVLRRPPPDAVVQVQASRLRARLIEWLTSRDRGDGLCYLSPGPGAPESVDCWTSAQIISAIAPAPEFTAEQMHMMLRGVTQIMASELIEKHEDRHYGWRRTVGGEPMGAIGAWILNAVSHVHQRRSVLVPGDVVRLRANAQELEDALAHYRPLNSGGWNLYVNQVEPDDHNTYVAVLMLDALLSAREGGLAWGSSAEHDAAIVRTCEWLLRTYETTPDPRPGWRRSVRDVDAAKYDGMTLQAYATLLRAEETSLIRLPPAMCDEITEHLIDCQPRSLSYETTTAEFGGYVQRDGQVRTVSEAVTFYWHPWAIACSARWLKRAQVKPQPPEKVIAVRRVLHRAVNELGEDAIRTVEKGWPHQAAELLYCLNAVSRP